MQHNEGMNFLVYLGKLERPYSKEDFLKNYEVFSNPLISLNY